MMCGYWHLGPRWWRSSLPLSGCSWQLSAACRSPAHTCGLRHWTACSRRCHLSPWTHTNTACLLLFLKSKDHSSLFLTMWGRTPTRTLNPTLSLFVCVCECMGVRTGALGLQVAWLAVPRLACRPHTSKWWRRCCNYGRPSQLEAE